ncbi:MAG: hypothetical protein JO256_11710 [Alphaproteobacteria bacterium]|nr:hypothetical protein [Alphaproteobacteria bacterium]
MKFSNLLLVSTLALASAGVALAQVPAGAPPAGGPGGGGRAALQAACGADIQANCANAGRGMRQCLTDNQAKLSAGCKSALAALPPPGQGRGAPAPAGQ